MYFHPLSLFEAMFVDQIAYFYVRQRSAEWQVRAEDLTKDVTLPGWLLWCPESRNELLAPANDTYHSVSRISPSGLHASTGSQTSEGFLSDFLLDVLHLLVMRLSRSDSRWQAEVSLTLRCLRGSWNMYHRGWNGFWLTPCPGRYCRSLLGLHLLDD